MKLIKGTRWSVFFHPPTTTGSNMRPCGSFYVCSFVSMVSHHWTDQQETHLVRRGVCKQKLHLQETPPVPLTHQLDIYLIIHKSFFRAETLHNHHYYPFTAFQLWRFDYKLIANWYFVKENHVLMHSFLKHKDKGEWGTCWVAEIKGNVQSLRGAKTIW